MGDDGQMQGLRIVAEAVYDLARRAAKMGARAEARLQRRRSSAERLFDLFKPFRAGACPIVLNYQNQQSGGDIELGSEWKVNLDEHLLAGLREWLKPENVRVIY